MPMTRSSTGPFGPGSAIVSPTFTLCRRAKFSLTSTSLVPGRSQELLQVRQARRHAVAGGPGVLVRVDRDQVDDRAVELRPRVPDASSPDRRSAAPRRSRATDSAIGEFELFAVVMFPLKTKWSACTTCVIQATTGSSLLRPTPAVWNIEGDARPRARR